MSLSYPVWSQRNVRHPAKPIFNALETEQLHSFLRTSTLQQVIKFTDSSSIMICRTPEIPREDSSR